MIDRAEELRERVLEFTVRCIKLVNVLPKTVAGRHVGGQLLGAATSAGADYEEACGAESQADFVHKMQIVLKELRESLFWLRVTHRAGLFAARRLRALIQECDELCRIVAKSVITAKRSR